MGEFTRISIRIVHFHSLTCIMYVLPFFSLLFVWSAVVPTLKCRCRFFQVKEILVFFGTESRKPLCQWWVGLLVFSPFNNNGRMVKELVHITSYYNSYRNLISIRKRGFSIIHQLNSLARWIQANLFVSPYIYIFSLLQFLLIYSWAIFCIEGTNFNFWFEITNLFSFIFYCKMLADVPNIRSPVK